jgi:GH15 family glucan-1,4-alpha-glucosidase
VGATADDDHTAIGDHAAIGDGRTAALISRGGSLDWLCLPRPDSPSLFAALLDRTRGGSFVIRPDGPARARRRYIGRTNVLETTFEHDGGAVRVVDFMPVADESDKAHMTWPEHQVVRIIEGVRGEVAMRVRFDPRPNYGRGVPEPRPLGAQGWLFEYGPDVIVLRSAIAVERRPGTPGLHATVRVRAGERLPLLMTFTQGHPAVLPPLGEWVERQREASIAWWERWSSRMRYDGPWPEAVTRSALALKLMTHAPSGAVIAAPTTSLPELIGGDRNWDYRYCWIRDASMTSRTLFDLGYQDEGLAFTSWLLHATRLTWPELQNLYDVYGRADLPERTLDQFEGYAGSRPVRVGNAAEAHLQLDTYGELIDAMFGFVQRGGRLDRAAGRMLRGLAETVCRRWSEPDEGIWEIRAGRRHHTYSKGMCWVALDRIIRLAEAGEMEAPVDRYRDVANAIRNAVETQGYSTELSSYVTEFGGDDVDASLLLLGIYGYMDPGSSRMRSTCTRVHERLGVKGLLRRYRLDTTPDGLPGGEGAFGICSFWGVECQARGGAVDEAAKGFEHLLTFANDVGLYGEEIDPETGAALGNFPQAFTHVGLIHAALAFADITGRGRRADVSGARAGEHRAEAKT